jgi:hypothetical protein
VGCVSNTFSVGESRVVDMPSLSVICLDPFVGEDVVRRLPCNHIFHAECINKWFSKSHYTCPLCVATYYTPPQMPIEPPPVVLHPRERAYLVYISQPSPLY